LLNVLRLDGQTEREKPYKSLPKFFDRMQNFHDLAGLATRSLPRQWAEYIRDDDMDELFIAVK
jgi:hypothetical protein